MSFSNALGTFTINSDKQTLNIFEFSQKSITTKHFVFHSCLYLQRLRFKNTVVCRANLQKVLNPSKDFHWFFAFKTTQLSAVF